MFTKLTLALASLSTLASSLPSLTPRQSSGSVFHLSIIDPPTEIGDLSNVQWNGEYEANGFAGWFVPAPLGPPSANTPQLLKLFIQGGGDTGRAFFSADTSISMYLKYNTKAENGDITYIAKLGNAEEFEYEGTVFEDTAFTVQNGLFGYADEQSSAADYKLWRACRGENKFPWYLYYGATAMSGETCTAPFQLEAVFQ